MCAFSLITFVFFQGQEMPSKKLAKRAAALETCKRLHQLGELDEHLLPLQHKDPNETCSELFPLYKEETEGGIPQRGSSKRKERYNKEVCSILLTSGALICCSSVCVTVIPLVFKASH
jgi:endoribonuclease Dicer